MVSNLVHRAARRLAVWSALVLFFCTPVIAQEIDLRLTQVDDSRLIVDIANAGDGSNRLFLVEQAGRIFILENGVRRATPFLNIQNIVQNTADEQGLLSLAFAPDYETSGLFYTWYTAIGGGMVLARFQVSDDPNLADANSREIVLSVAQPQSNHNGGRLQFGPDGMLYLGLGDGGGSFDPLGAGQDGSTLLGKLIRIDVDPSHGSYAVPPDNPFVGNASVLDEIWALGLRNPWRIAFDSETGDLYIADVGQNQLEEVNFQPASSSGGENYGWVIMEGTNCVGGGNCNTSGLTLPVSEYGHGQDCSVTGGEVYRGTAYPNLVGMYFYADYCSGRIWGLTREGGEWSADELLDSSHLVSTFGHGEDGSVYLASQAGGIYLLSDGDVKPESGFGINAGLSDAWFNPLTNGQGFFVNVWEDTGVLFLGWFTYEVERPTEDVMAILGESGHRWITAQGPFAGDTATLDVYLSSGGVFDSPAPVVGPPEKIGTMTVVWTDCDTGVVHYELTNPVLSGSVPITRIVKDNVLLCEALQ